MAGTFIGGTLGYVKFGSTTSAGYAYAHWTLRLTCNLPRANSFLSPFQVTVQGVYSAKVTLSGPYDQDGMGALIIGAVYTFVLGFSPSLSFSIPARIADITLSNDEDDEPKVDSVEADSTGAFVLAIT